MPELVNTGDVRYVAVGGAGRLDLAPERVATLEGALQNRVGIPAARPAAVWEPPAQPGMVGGSGDLFDARSWQYNDFLSNLWEPLRADHPEWITRSSAGLDQSGTHTLWRYAFTPPHFERTVIVTANMHGNELAGPLALWLFLRAVANDWDTHPALANLRWNTRLIVIPSLNPWGCSQAPRTRTNSRGVNINRNFDYKWAAFSGPVGPDYKGTSAFSESETLAAKALLDAYPEAVAWLDLHDLDYATGAKDHIAYLPDVGLASPFEPPLARLLAQIRAAGESTELPTLSVPFAGNYAASQGVAAVSPEVRSDVDGSAKWDSATMTRGVRWYGNLILAAAGFSSQSVLGADESFARHLIYQAGADTVPSVSSTTYAEVPELRFEFPVPSRGIVELNGSITVYSPSTALRAFLSPSLGQANHPVNGLGSLKNSWWEPYADVPADGRVVIPIHAAFPVVPSYTDGSGGMRFALFAKTTVSNFLLMRVALTLTYTPSIRGDRLEVYSASGRGGTGVGALLKQFP